MKQFKNVFVIIHFLFCSITNTCGALSSAFLIMIGTIFWRYRLHIVRHFFKHLSWSALHFTIIKLFTAPVKIARKCSIAFRSGEPFGIHCLQRRQWCFLFGFETGSFVMKKAPFDTLPAGRALQDLLGKGKHEF